MTTRPARVKQVLNVDIPHPRDFNVLSSDHFRRLVAATKDALHEEAEKAFLAGERELA